VFIRKR